MRLERCTAVEVSLTQNCSPIGPASAEVKVTFRGVSPSPGQHRYRKLDEAISGV